MTTTAAAQQMLCLRRATTGLFVTLVIGQQWIMTMMNNSIQVETEVVLSQPFNLTMTLSAAVTTSTSTGTSSLNSTTTSNLSSLSEAPTTAESPAEAEEAAAASEGAAEAAEEKTPSSESSNTGKPPQEESNSKPPQEQQEQQQKQQKQEQSPQPKPAAAKPQWETKAEKRAKRRQRFRQWHKEREEKQARKKATQQPEQSQKQERQKQQKQQQQQQQSAQSPQPPPPPPPTLEEQKRRGFGYPKYRDTKFPSPVQAVLKKYKVKKRTEPPVSLQQLEEIVRQTKQQKQSSWQPYGGPPVQGQDHSIQRIYYTNLAKNLVRREITETHLKNLHSNTGVPFKRMEAKKGDTNVCTSKNTDKKCIGVSGLSYSLLNILQNENVTGPTLVLEDDWVWHDANFDRLYTAMEMLPNDWDLVRFDCWEMSQKQFAANIAQPYLINTTTYTTPQTSWCQSDRLCKRRFYGGTHAMLFRGRPSSNHKLQQTWSIQPYDDVDGRISTEGGHQFGLISYCLNLGLGSFIEIPTEVSDIPKDVVHQ